MREYDLIVIGSGVGLTVLNEGLQAGLECALVESSKMGGTCLTRGCIPSKVLTYVADMIRAAKHSQKIGIQFKIEKLEWDIISKRMWSQIDESKNIESALSNAAGLTVYRGTGEFTGKYTMKVKSPDGSYSKEFKGKRIVLASGGRSFIPPIKGLEEAGYVTTESFFGDRFPDKPWESVILVGGGIIAAEFAHIFSAFGTKVTIVEAQPGLISSEEREVSDFVERNFRNRMGVFTNHRATALRAHGGKKYLTAEESGSKKTIELEADEVFICVGRRSNTDLLQTEKCGITTYGSMGWIKTNQYLETNVPDIWAIGDANGQFQFRHKANYDAEICVRNIFGSPDEKTAVDYSAVPWAIFTDPQVGHVGMTEKQAIENGHLIYRAVRHYSSVAKGFAMGFNEDDEDDGFVKLIIDESMRILGAHVTGPHAETLIQPFVYLMNSGFTCDTIAEDISQAGATGRKIADEPIPKLLKHACPGAGSIAPIFKSMVIHPSLNEVTGWILGSLEPVNIPVKHYHNV